MCGILFSKNNSFSTEIFKEALNLMNHRGPDSSATLECKDNVFLGHKRLKIIDLNERSKQPFLASDKKSYIVFNGEIYNHKELKKKFRINTRTESDTEVLVELYLKLGPESLQYLNGMFSFVIYNIETGKVFAARDRLGIKPLYYLENNNKIIFSSEIAPILNLDKNIKYSKIGIRQYLKLRAFFKNYTLYENIKMFPAGKYYEDGRFQTYWSLDNIEKNKTWDLEETKEIINKAIKYRLISDVEVGTYLSGGLDSTIITAIANKEHSWTIGFNDNNEFEYAKIAADRYNTKHHEILINKEEFLSIAKFLINKRKEPLSVPNEALIYKMTKEVKKFNTVILSGEGADELFFGYNRIFEWAANNSWDLNAFDKYYSYGSHKDDEILEDILSDLDHINDPLNKVAYFFQIYHLHGLLRRLDNSTMQCSVEARVPFVDHNIIEYMYGAPMSFRMRDGIIKYPLKTIYKEIIPDKIINRKKVGFPVPLNDIFGDRENTGMDNWLQFNLETLLDNKWEDISNDIFKN